MEQRGREQRPVPVLREEELRIEDEEPIESAAVEARHDRRHDEHRDERDQGGEDDGRRATDPEAHARLLRHASTIRAEGRLCTHFRRSSRS
jgi:hypothetical protein